MLSVGQVLDVRRVGQVAEAEAERGDVAVVLQNRQSLDRASLPVNINDFARHQTLLVEDWRIFAAGRCHEAIAEAGVHGAGCRFIEVDVDLPTLVDEQRAQIVDPMRVVGVLVRDQNAVNPINGGIEKLHAQVG